MARFRVVTTFWLLALASTPAFAQTDLSGTWVPIIQEDWYERFGEGPDLGDYMGIPVNDAARARADTWDASLHTLPEWQCRPHPADYGVRFSPLRIWNEIDVTTQAVTAWRTHKEWMAQERAFFMDSRSHPPDYAAHSWQGFSTATWEGNKLKVTTTHLKTGYHRRNGLPRSDRATLTEYYIRHGNLLSIIVIVEDPVYLTEPLVRTHDYQLDNARNIAAYPCQTVVEIPRPKGAVPHHLPGTNPFLNEVSERHTLPQEAVRGGAETLYPEYQTRLRQLLAELRARPSRPSRPSGQSSR